jgi:hypothetical protein
MAPATAEPTIQGSTESIQGNEEEADVVGRADKKQKAILHRSKYYNKTYQSLKD